MGTLIETEVKRLGERQWLSQAQQTSLLCFLLVSIFAHAQTTIGLIVC